MSEKQKRLSWSERLRVLRSGVPVTIDRIINARVGKRTTTREDKGAINVNYSWTDKRPHPPNMNRYEELNRDAEVETAITLKTEMVAGVGFHTEMGEDVKDERNKKEIDKICEETHMDERLQEITRVQFEKGFCPVEKLADRTLKILPPETFYIWRKPTSFTPYKYSQEVDGTEVATWQGNELKDIIIYAHKATPTNPYGKAISECIVRNLDTRKAFWESIPAIVKKYGFPFRVWSSTRKEIADVIYEQATSREADQDIFIEGVTADEWKVYTELMDPRLNLSPIMQNNDEQIAEGLFAPLILYLRNATEASATKMLEAIDRHIQGIQKHMARKTENEIWLPIVGEPVPRMVWGQPKTGLEEIQLSDIAQLYQNRAITFEQTQDLLKQMGLPLPDIQPGEQPMIPQPELPLLDMTRMSNLERGLKPIEDNFHAGTMSITEAFREGIRVIDVHVKSAREQALKRVSASLGKTLAGFSPEGEREFRLMRDDLIYNFRQRILPTGEPHTHDEPRERFTVIAHR